MKIIRATDYKDMSRKAANIISAQVIMKPNCVLGLATGGTPVGTYAQLIDWYNKGDLDFAEVTTVNLDEYRGLPRTHEQSYWYFMQKNLFEHVNVRPDHIHVPDGSNPDAEAACKEYDQIIHDVGGIDLQLLGIGVDGHIGFNEPGEAFELGTHCVDLTESTIEANKRGLHHGHQDHHAGPQGADGGQRRQQGRDHQEGFLWPRHSRGPRFHPADAPRLHPGGRSGCPQPGISAAARRHKGGILP